MLLLARREGDEITIGDDIMIKVLKRGSQMVLGIEAPKHMPIIRHEIPKRKREGIKEKALKYSKEEYNAGV